MKKHLLHFVQWKNGKKTEDEKVLKENLEKEKEEREKEDMDLTKRSLAELRLSIINKK